MIPVVLAMLAGCMPPPATEVDCKPLGKIVDAEVVPTSFNESIKMRIKTTQAVVVIHELPMVIIGAEAQTCTYSNGQRYFGWDGAEYNYPY